MLSNQGVHAPRGLRLLTATNPINQLPYPGQGSLQRTVPTYLIEIIYKVCMDSHGENVPDPDLWLYNFAAFIQPRYGKISSPTW